MSVFTCSKSVSQNLDKHQWNDRLLLIFTEDKSSELLQKQVQILAKDKAGLQERKLKVYQFSKNEFKYGFNAKWKPSTLKTTNYFKSREHFKVVLIGLDSGIKLKQAKIVSLEKLFTIIDGMPMRKAELKKQ